MRKVLAIIAAIMFVAVVFSPATGYTISSGANESYSIKSTPVNYSISMGTPAHNVTPGMIPGEVSPASAVTVTHVPYSIKLGAAVPYSVKLASGVNATPEGVQTPNTVLLGSLAKNAVVAPSAKETPAAQPPAAAPAANATKNVTAPAPAPTKFSIMGMVLNETSNTGLADWKVNLEQPTGIVVAIATTNSSGSYSFKDLKSGAYIVAEVVAKDWTPVNPADGKQNVNLTDKDITGLNFVNKMVPVENVTPPSNVTAAVTPTVNATQTNSTTPAVTPTVNATQTNSTTPK